MVKRALNLFLMILALSFSSSAQSQNQKVFTFSHTPNIFSEGWDVSLDSDKLSIKRNDYEIKDYGKFSLTKVERAEIWRLIRVAEFNRIKFADGPKGNCDTQYLFTLKDRTGSYSVSVDTWKAEAEPPLKAIVNRVKGLIKKYAGVEPKFPSLTRIG
jgi:hypothetical protein